jgi:hypothetical protein
VTEAAVDANKEEMMRVRFKLFGPVLATFVVLAGCGGSSSSSSDQGAKFKTSYESVANQFKHDSQAIGAAIKRAAGKTDAQIATEFHDLATRWQKHVSQLETLKPPSNLAATFNTLTSAASRAETDLNAIVSAAKTDSKSAAEQASASLVTDILSAKSASATITKKLGTK